MMAWRHTRYPMIKLDATHGPRTEYEVMVEYALGVLLPFLSSYPLTRQKRKSRLASATLQCHQICNVRAGWPPTPAGPGPTSAFRPMRTAGEEGSLSQSSDHVGHSRILMRSFSTIQSCCATDFVAKKGMSFSTASSTRGLSCCTIRSTIMPAAVAGG